MEVELPRQALAGGLELVDTPGVGGVSPAVSLSALDLLPTADAVLVVSDASQEFTAPELAFLRQCTVLCPVVVSVLTKTDVHQHWRTIAELDRGHLARAGLDVPLVPVAARSSCWRWSVADAGLHEESGFPALYEHLPRSGPSIGGADRPVDPARPHLGQRASSRWRSGPSWTRSRTRRGYERLRDLEAARERVEDLGRSSSRWQQLLTDGVTDLMADIDYDLRDRARVIIREAEDTIDAEDPGPLWPDDRRLAGPAGRRGRRRLLRLGLGAVGVAGGAGDRAVRPTDGGVAPGAGRRGPRRGPRRASSTSTTSTRA